MKLIFATGNKGKLKEVKNIFSNYKVEIFSLSEIGFDEEIEENGATFEENAFIKAKEVHKKYNVPVIADDSGLVVDQLDSRPGVYSARYAGENSTYDDNNKKLLDELSEQPQPHLAHFECCAVYLDANHKISSHGILKGEIVKEFHGEHGFGYDPIFKPEGFKLTLAEMDLEQKNKISHRAQAFNLLLEKLVKNKVFAKN